MQITKWGGGGGGEGSWMVKAPQTCDQKVRGSSPGRSSRNIFFSRVNFLCWLLFQCLFHPRVTVVARKRFWSFCQKCRWQVMAIHAYTLCMWRCMMWCMVLWCAQNAPKWLQFHVALALQQSKSTVSTPLGWIFKMRYKNLQPLI